MTPTLTHASTALLHAEGLCKRFGGFQALDRVQLTVLDGQITGLIGPNGAGKTTLFHSLAGSLPLDEGSIYFNQQPIQHLPSHQRVQRGLVRTFQVTRVFSRLSVLENLLLAAPQTLGEWPWQPFLARGSMQRQQEHLTEEALALLADLGLDHKAHDYAGSLSGGQRKLLELGRTLMTRPRLLLLDEPAAGVNPVLIDRICEYIVRWNRQGISFLIIEHNMDVVMSLCDSIWVLAEGRNLVNDTPDVVRSHPQVLEAYLGH